MPKLLCDCEKRLYANYGYVSFQRLGLNQARSKKGDIVNFTGIKRIIQKWISKLLILYMGQTPNPYLRRDLSGSSS